MTKAVVIGLGNPLLTDEGIGVHLITELTRRAREPWLDGVNLVDLGTSGARVLHAIAGQKKAVFIDCTLMDEEPGTIRRFRPEEAKSRKILDQISFHEGDLLGTLELSHRLGECPAQIIIFGIQPQDLRPGENLSPLLAAKIPEYVQVIKEELISD